jgi:Protein of unknown function (DUF3047)
MSVADRSRLAAMLMVLCGPVAAGGLVPLDAGSGSTPAAPWHVAGLPMQKKPFTRFDMVELDGKRVLRIEAERSYGNLVHALPSGEEGRFLSWRWRVDLPAERSNLRTRAGDDSAVEVCVMFDLPLQDVPFVDRQLLRLARSRSTEPLPTATLCYVWDAHFPVGTVMDNAYTRRIRLIILRGADMAPKTWRIERRDVHADFLRLFGDEATEVPDIVGVGIAGDSDNTQGHSLAYVVDLRLEP